MIRICKKHVFGKILSGLKKVAIKFCGGCDPSYDRVEYYESIREVTGNNIDWVPVDDSNCDAVLLICGCDRTCAKASIKYGGQIVTVKNNEIDPKKITELILE